MAMRDRIETRIYHSYSDDFVETADQEYELPADYRWIDDSRSGKVKYAVLHGVGLVIASVYDKIILGRRVHDRDAIKRYHKEDGGGYFIYANHTQPVGDATLPMLLSFPKRAYVIVSPANLGIPVLGPLLPYLGALPTPSNMQGLKELDEAVEQRLSEGSAIMVYPEAHLWPWHTGIRPLPISAFSFPVATGRPVFTATTTYHESRFRKHPCATVYVDGPFYPDESLPKAKRKRKLRDEVQAAMERRAALSTCEYVHYEPDPESGLASTYPKATQEGEDHADPQETTGPRDSAAGSSEEGDAS